MNGLKPDLNPDFSPGLGAEYVPPCAKQLADCFNHRFSASHRVRIVGGGNEPSYLPAHQRRLSEADAWRGALITHSFDYPASALHEIAHWCIAGPTRRQLEDFGYSYEPPPRTITAQRGFFRVERRVQAIESLFARATGVHFVVSADNLAASAEAVDAFAEEVAAAHQAMSAQWLEQSSGGQKTDKPLDVAHRLPVRAQQYLQALQAQRLVVPTWPAAPADRRQNSSSALRQSFTQHS